MAPARGALGGRCRSVPPIDSASDIRPFFDTAAPPQVTPGSGLPPSSARANAAPAPGPLHTRPPPQPDTPVTALAEGFVCWDDLLEAAGAKSESGAGSSSGAYSWSPPLSPIGPAALGGAAPLTATRQGGARTQVRRRSALSASSVSAGTYSDPGSADSGRESLLSALDEGPLPPALSPLRPPSGDARASAEAGLSRFRTRLAQLSCCTLLLLGELDNIRGKQVI